MQSEHRAAAKSQTLSQPIWFASPFENATVRIQIHHLLLLLLLLNPKADSHLPSNAARKAESIISSIVGRVEHITAVVVNSLVHNCRP